MQSVDYAYLNHHCLARREKILFITDERRSWFRFCSVGLFTGVGGGLRSTFVPKITAPLRGRTVVERRIGGLVVDIFCSFLRHLASRSCVHSSRTVSSNGVQKTFSESFLVISSDTCGRTGCIQLILAVKSIELGGIGLQLSHTFSCGTHCMTSPRS